jgi:ABC-type sugar transport system permease subunit
VPAVGFLVLFFLYPLYLMVDMSLREVSIGTVARSDNDFVGLANYQTVFGSADFLAAVPRTALYVAGTVVLQLVLGLALAVILTSRLRGVHVGRTLVFFVWLLPPVVSGVVWRLLLEGTASGALNHVLLRLGVVDTPYVFLTKPAVAMTAITLINTWAFVPFASIVFMAALQNVPEDVYEAAKVDGAGPGRRFRSITLPFVAPTVAIVALLLTIYSFKTFDFIYVLTTGGPGSATSTIPFLAYLRSFVQFDFGVGSAIAVLAVGAALLLALPYLVRAQREEHYS